MIKREILLRKGEAVGNIRVTDYGNSLWVAAFIPGWWTSFPGDSPKMNPDFDEWFLKSGGEFAKEADAKFDCYLALARSAGWKDWKDG